MTDTRSAPTPPSAAGRAPVQVRLRPPQPRRVRFPDGPPVGDLFLQFAPRGPWLRWLTASGPRVLTRHAALGADHAALPVLAQLPRCLRGLSLACLPITDDQLGDLCRRGRSLRWLDLRGTTVTVDGLRALRRLHRLRRLGLDDTLAAAVRSGTVRLPRWVRIVGTDAELVELRDGEPRPDPAALAELLTRAATDYPGIGVASDGAATAKAEILLDVGRPLEALAVLAPVLSGGHLGALLVASRAADALHSTGAALAALAAAPPSAVTAAARANLLRNAAPASALRAIGLALSQDPQLYQAHWSRCAILLSRAQLDAADAAFTALARLAPTSVDTFRIAAMLAAARGRQRDAQTGWQRVLAERPDDVGALAGLAAAQRPVNRSQRPAFARFVWPELAMVMRPGFWSMRWVRTLNRASQVDIAGPHGSRLLREVTAHRRRAARTVAAIVCGVSFKVGEQWFVGKPAGIPVAAAVAASLLTSGLVWRATPADVRRTIRRADGLTGSHRGPDWRRAAVELVIAVVCLVLIGPFGGNS